MSTNKYPWLDQGKERRNMPDRGNIRQLCKFRKSFPVKFRKETSQGYVI